MAANMKRITLGIIILLLTQILSGYLLAAKPYSPDSNGKKEVYTTTAIPPVGKNDGEGPYDEDQKETIIEESQKSSRSSELENDGFGGSWYDEFLNNKSIKDSANVSVDEGMVGIAENVIIPGGNCSGLWHFNETSGETAHDWTGNNNNGTVSGGANWTGGKFGGSLEFDGLDDRVDCGNSSNLDVNRNDSFTVTAWINTTNSTNQSIVTRGRFGGSTHGYAILIDERNPHKATVVVGDNATEVRIESGTNVDDGKWHHIGLSRDTAADQIILYVDGIREGNITDNTTENISVTDSLQLGSSWNGTSFRDWFDGRIDEVAVWNRTLSSREIEGQVNRFRNSGHISSTMLALPNDMQWSYLSLEKTEPSDTYVNISVENEFNTTIIGYLSVTGTNIDLTGLNGMGIDKIRFQAVLSGNGQYTPRLMSWGVEWIKENSWRDSFIGDEKIGESTNAVVSGNVEIDNLTLAASIISSPIELPENYFWDTLRINCSVPDQNNINITVHDNITGDVLTTTTASGGKESINIGDIHPADHGWIYLKASFLSAGINSPILNDWGVNWTPSGGIATPLPLEDFPTVINVTEDSPKDNLIDLREYFFDTYAERWPPSYAIESISDSMNITIVLNGSKLDLSGLVVNWTGTVEIILNCTNSFGRSILSSPINITVINIDDGPVWSRVPPALSLAEDNMHTTDFSLDDYLFDAEGDALELILTLSDENISATVGNDTKITITPSKDYNGKTSIDIYARQLNNHSMETGIITIPVTVVPVNDHPDVESPHPKDGSIERDVNVNFSWTPRDIDNDPSELSYDFYLGKTQPPALHSRDVELNYIFIKGLEDSTTYYWYVKAFDGDLFGTTPENFWSFSVDTEVSIPEVSLQAPLNGITLNMTAVNLTWMSENTEEDTTYHVFLGGRNDTIIEVATTGNTWYPLTDLGDIATYYWKVIPTTPTLEGRCMSGIWKFEINVSFEPRIEISMEIMDNLPRLDIIQGKTANFTISIANTGNVPVSISFEDTGLAGGVVDYNNTVVVENGETKIIKVIVSIPIDVDPGEYLLTIIGDYTTGEITLDLPIIVKPQKIPPEAKIKKIDGGEPGKKIKFDARDSTPNGNIVSYQWDFDDGVDSDGDGNKMNDVDADTAIASWKYEKEGRYTITLTVSDNDNQTNTTSMEIEVLYPSNTRTVICSVSIVVALVMAGGIFLSRLGKREVVKRAESLDRKRQKLLRKRQKKSGSEEVKEISGGPALDAGKGK